MARIKNIEEVKNKLTLGKIMASEVWNYDNQKNLKGNSVRAFEKDLNRICKFEVLKSGRNKVYDIKEIFENIKVKEIHGNTIALRGNSNKKGIIGFNNCSRTKFVASVIINKIEYFEQKKSNDYKTIGQFMQAFGLYSEREEKISERVNDAIRSAFTSAMIKMQRLGYITVYTKYIKVIGNRHIEIDDNEYEEIKNIERKEFCELVDEKKVKKYKSLYNYERYSKQLDKYQIVNQIKRKCGVDYVYRMYLIETVKNTELCLDHNYCNLIYEVFEYDEYTDNTVQENIELFVYTLEVHFEEKIYDYIGEQFIY